MVFWGQWLCCPTRRYALLSSLGAWRERMRGATVSIPLESPHNGAKSDFRNDRVKRVRGFSPARGFPVVATMAVYGSSERGFNPSGESSSAHSAGNPSTGRPGDATRPPTPGRPRAWYNYPRELWHRWSASLRCNRTFLRAIEFFAIFF